MRLRHKYKMLYTIKIGYEYETLNNYTSDEAYILLFWIHNGTL